MKNKKRTIPEQIKKLEKTIQKFGDYDGARAKKLAELRAKQ